MFGVSPITPAYGRDYKNLKEAQADLDADKDFMCLNGYINRPQLVELGLRKIQVHFKRKTKTGMLVVK